MGRHAAQFLYLAALSLAAPLRAQDDVYLGGPPPGVGPLKVEIGFNLLNLTAVSERDETIEFDGSIYLQWLDPRLAYDPTDVDLEPGDWVVGDYTRAPRKIYQGYYAATELFEGWRPHVDIPNGIGDRQPTNMAVGVWPDGMVVYAETFFARVETPMDLRRYPFDRQSLEVFFHPFHYQRDEVVLIPNDALAATWNQNLGIAEWAREAVLMSERPIEIEYFDDRLVTMSEFVVTIQLRRRPLHVLVSLLFPLVVLVCLTWSVFWMDEETISNRINISFIGILSVVAYYFVLLEGVPKASYLTLLDVFMIATFLILAAGAIVNIVVDKLNKGDRVEIGDRVDRVCRWAFPVGYAVVTLVLAFVFFRV
jgi:hypothetical protein